jgi:hypothetical protein
MGELDGDFAFLETMNEVLMIVLEYTELARQADNPLVMGVYLKMASRSMRCALEIYGDRFATGVPEEEKQ